MFSNMFLKHNPKVLKNIFEASCNSGDSILINAPSSAIYGNLNSESIKESDSGKPISAHELSAKLREDYLSNSTSQDIKVRSLRLLNVIGSGEKSLADSAKFHLVPATISRICDGKNPIMDRNSPQSMKVRSVTFYTLRMLSGCFEEPRISASKAQVNRWSIRIPW